MQLLPRADRAVLEAEPHGLAAHLGAAGEVQPRLDLELHHVVDRRLVAAADRRPEVGLLLLGPAHLGLDPAEQAGSGEAALEQVARQRDVREQDRQHLREQAVLVLDRLRPCRHGVGDLEPHGRRRGHHRAVDPDVARRRLRLAEVLAQVVEEEVDRRRGELGRPVRRRGVERDLDALEPVALELATDERAQCLVEIRQRGVQGYVNDGRHWCGP